MNRSITYRFELENGVVWQYELTFDEFHNYIHSPKIRTSAPAGAALAQASPALDDAPKRIQEWTKLEYQKCSHCPLSENQSPQCPVARNLDHVIEDSKETLSFTRAQVTVITKERSYSKECATQEGLRSLFGLLMASSGCPYLDWLRPLARFHLPFADMDENLFRVLSLQLLEAFFSSDSSPGSLSSPEPGLGKATGYTAKAGSAETSRSFRDCARSIEARYRNVEKVNHSFIKRIRTHCQQDADKNAIAALDIFVQMFNFQAESNFSSLRKYFS